MARGTEKLHVAEDWGGGRGVEGRGGEGDLAF